MLEVESNLHNSEHRLKIEFFEAVDEEKACWASVVSLEILKSGKSDLNMVTSKLLKCAIGPKLIASSLNAVKVKIL